jgi:hypothetical protein
MAKEFCDIATAAGFKPAQLALKWAADREYMGSVIIGATTMEQLKVCCLAAEGPGCCSTCALPASRAKQSGGSLTSTPYTEATLAALAGQRRGIRAGRTEGRDGTDRSALSFQGAPAPLPYQDALVLWLM